MPDTPKTSAAPSSRYTDAIAVPAEGERVGVVMCLQCGAAILLRSMVPMIVDPIVLHDRWHDGEAIRHAAVPRHAHNPGDMGP